MEFFLLNQTAIFTLILGRIGGLVATAPLLSSPAIPIRVRGLMAVAMSLLVLPIHGRTPLGPAGLAELDVPAFARMMAGEVLVGLLLGLGITILLSGVQVAGQIVSQMSGMALGDVFNPALDDNVSVFTQMFYFVTLAVFVAIGGHRLMMDGLLRTFEWAPPGQAHLGDSYGEAVVILLAQSFELGLRASAPLLIALFLSTLILGLISRTLPQINTIVVGFSANSLLTLALMFISIGAIAMTFEGPVEGAMELLTDAVRDSVQQGVQ